MSHYPVIYEDPLNPRLSISGDHLSRQFDLLDLAEGVGGKAGETLLLLKDCFPEGSGRDDRGATSRQLRYIIDLADFEPEDVGSMMTVLFEIGGISVVQASHLIEKLKRQKTEE